MVYRSTAGAALNWRKGSASREGGECVEVAATGASMLVRDSRDQDSGMIELDPAQWRGLVHAIRNGDLDGR
ncbi:DUF397 domain-containing protein [Actinomadura sp. WMMB 499]|uniref:DUF397 domain-containing protein n=1 Tax=Actinomadura sp. WMMB 499 TaxID=1219491 RepID=UPI001247D353|nr:DUF397 domain-containing protein [Actinomadura sp. WMMB 499]QFG23743.1 DUF397 domain-containing protein [Actinomadura sp. WMMB 499]